jgi:Uma2 family endonuclease
MDLSDPIAPPAVTRYKLDVEQYHRMGEAGVLGPDARVELIEGELIDMAPMGSKHWSVVSRLNQLLVLAVGTRALVSAQMPVRLGDRSEPEPDLCVLQASTGYYAQALPTAAAIRLIIEVSDSTLRYDLRTKAALYASHGIPAYWVFDLEAGLLHIHTQPDGDRFLSVIARRDLGPTPVPGLDGVEVDLAGVI